MARPSPWHALRRRTRQTGGRLDDATADRHRAVLEAVGLPLHYRHDQWPKLLETMKLDKKSRGDLLRFIVLDGLAKPTVLEGPDPAVLLAASAKWGSSGACPRAAAAPPVGPAGDSFPSARLTRFARGDGHFGRSPAVHKRRRDGTVR